MTEPTPPKKTLRLPARAVQPKSPSQVGQPSRAAKPASHHSKPLGLGQTVLAARAVNSPSSGATKKDAKSEVPPERLSKRVAQIVPCSRSEAEQYIAGGWVQVDGRVVEEPQFRALERHTITIDPKARLEDADPVTLLLHKPADWVDGTEESLSKLNRDARRAHFDDARSLLNAAHRAPANPYGPLVRVLQRHFKELENCVPLENAASGLIVFTQDWRIVRKLEEDLGSMEHELMVDVRDAVSAAMLEALQRIAKSDDTYPLTKISLSSATPERSTLRFAVKGAHRGWIAYLCKEATLEILDMRRTRLGRIHLGDLPVGKWRYLAPSERF